MLEITPEDIAALGDADLRTLVGLLCEAELRKRGLPASAVTWGGNQDAADGGIDVRVRLPAGTVIDGFIPRAESGFQVKKPDMPASEIKDEMRPKGELRPSIRDLADKAGAYIIACSSGSVTDTALTDRVNAMEAAVHDLPSGSALLLDFYDRTRLATWVRAHPGLIPWVRWKAGRQIAGWQSYGPWADPDEPIDAEFVTDSGSRLFTGANTDGAGLSAVAGIERIRAALSESGTAVRLVGLSGVGKTRLVQALFDDRLGEHSLDPALAIYTNTSDSPDPPAVGMVSDLIRAESRSIVVVDNCPAELHRRLAEVCKGSAVSVITIEYDIREDQPEGTEVFSLEPSSGDITKKVLQNHFPHISQVDAGRISDFSGGNFRVALALAGTIESGDSVSGLTDAELFERLFRQRHEPDPSLLQAAEACSLLYSFDGENTDGESELGLLARLIGQDPIQLYGKVAELRRRELVQSRSIWRAVLPHAIANRLARRALQDIPLSKIEDLLVATGTDRVRRSFSRRLGYLHDDQQSQRIVERWLTPDGLLSHPASFDDLQADMFSNIAPVAPAAVLTALEMEAGGPDRMLLMERSGRYVRLLRSIAYEPALFERSAHLLSDFAAEGKDEEAAEAHRSLFFLYLSGTHATIEQRVRTMEQLLRSPDPKRRAIGLRALEALLESWHFASAHDFEFGSRPRDYGANPTFSEAQTWFAATLRSAEKLTTSGSPVSTDVSKVVAASFRGLWTRAQVYDDLERVCRTIAGKEHWRDGWISVRQTLHYHKDNLSPDVRARLVALEKELRPTTVVQRVRSIVLSPPPGTVGLDDYEEDDDGEEESTSGWQRTEELAQKLGAEVANDGAALSTLLPDLLSGSGRLIAFGQGLGASTSDPEATWTLLKEGLAGLPEAERNMQVLVGFLRTLGETKSAAASSFLDSAVADTTLGPRFPTLQCAVPLDTPGVERLKRSLELSIAPIEEYRALAWGRTHASLKGTDLAALITQIGSKPEGAWPALEIVFYRLYDDKQAKRSSEPEVIQAGRSLLANLEFDRANDREDNHLSVIVRRCLAGSDAIVAARMLCDRFKLAMVEHLTDVYRFNDFFQALCETQPLVVLDTFFTGESDEQRTVLRTLRWLSDDRQNPIDAIPDDTMVQWCDQNPDKRYPAMAGAVSFENRHEDKDHTSRWSMTARRLLERAPDPASLVRTFARRFRPSSWSGSLASILEERQLLLEELKEHQDPAIAAAVVEEADILAREIAREREWEAAHDRRHDETFE